MKLYDWRNQSLSYLYDSHRSRAIRLTKLIAVSGRDRHYNGDTMYTSTENEYVGPLNIQLIKSYLPTQNYQCVLSKNTINLYRINVSQMY